MDGVALSTAYRLAVRTESIGALDWSLLVLQK